jgi:hypothetical protein
MKIKTHVKACKNDDCPRDVCGLNHNQAVASGLKVKSGVKTGQSQIQHNQPVTHALTFSASVWL